MSFGSIYKIIFPNGKHYIGLTTTSGPGMALKTEAIGLATMLEIPLLIINILQQRNIQKLKTAFLLITQNICNAEQFFLTRL